jgi:hypothetical protein
MPGHCVVGAEGDDQVDKTEELMAAVARLIAAAEGGGHPGTPREGLNPR